MFDKAIDVSPRVQELFAMAKQYEDKDAKFVSTWETTIAFIATGHRNGAGHHLSDEAYEYNSFRSYLHDLALLLTQAPSRKLSFAKTTHPLSEFIYNTLFFLEVNKCKQDKKLNSGLLNVFRLLFQRLGTTKQCNTELVAKSLSENGASKKPTRTLVSFFEKHLQDHIDFAALKCRMSESQTSHAASRKRAR